MRQKRISVKHRGNGQGTVYMLPTGKYLARRVLGYYLDDSGKRHVRTVSRVFAKKRDAIAALPTLIEAVKREKDITLHNLNEIYTNSREYDSLSKSQQDKMTFAWNRWKDLEFRGITTLTVADIEDHIALKTHSYYPAHDMKVMLSHLYKIAIKQEIISFNKTEYVELPYETPKAKRQTWTKEEIDAFWKDYAANPFTARITTRLRKTSIESGFLISLLRE